MLPFSDLPSHILKVDLGQMHIFTPFCLFVAARILAERVQLQPSISEYRHALLFLHQVLERLKKTNPLAEIFLVQLRLADRVHRAEGQHEEGKDAGKDKARGDVPSSLSFTHSFQYVPNPMILFPDVIVRLLNCLQSNLRPAGRYNCRQPQQRGEYQCGIHSTTHTPPKIHGNGT